MTLDLLLAVGILLSTASQLRPSAAPIGPGEVCLVIWIALTIGRQTVQLGTQFTPALSRLVIFWLLFAVAQSIGTLTGFAIGDVHDTSLFMHDVLAYLLLAAISVLCVAGPGAGRSFASRRLVFGDGRLGLPRPAARPGVGMDRRRIARSLVLGPLARLVGESQPVGSPLCHARPSIPASRRRRSQRSRADRRHRNCHSSDLRWTAHQGRCIQSCPRGIRPDLHCAQTANMASLPSTKPHRPLGIRMDCHSRAAPAFCFPPFRSAIPSRSKPADWPTTWRRATSATRKRPLKSDFRPGRTPIDRGVESGMLGLGRVRTFRYRP